MAVRLPCPVVLVGYAGVGLKVQVCGILDVRKKVARWVMLANGEKFASKEIVANANPL